MLNANILNMILNKVKVIAKEGDNRSYIIYENTVSSSRQFHMPIVAGTKECI